MAASVGPNTDITIALPKEHADCHLQVQQRSRRRRPKGSGAGGGDGPKVKKQPQRGMGVAQLERLRALEWRKRMNETNAANRFPVCCTVSAVSSPVQFPEMAELWAAQRANAAGKMGMGLGQGQSFWGFNGQVDIRGSPAAASDHFPTDFNGGKGSSINTDINLSSVPFSVHCRRDNYSAYQKKMRVNGENLGGCWVNSDANERRFLELSIGQNQETTKQQNQSFAIETPLLAPHATYAVRNGQPGVEVVAVHRRTTSSGSEPAGKTMIEYYDFFPSPKSDSNNVAKLMMMGWKRQEQEQEQDQDEGGEDDETLNGNRRRSIHEYGSGCSGSSSIDLSLKL